MKIVLTCLLFVILAGLTSLSVDNSKVLILIIYNTSSSTASITNSKFSNNDKCMKAYNDIVNKNEFPHQQYFTIKGGCY